MPASVMFILGSETAGASDRREIEKAQIESLEDMRQLSLGGELLLRDPDCSGTRCSVQHPAIERSWHSLGRWHKEQQQRLKDEDAWWKLEAYTHGYERGLAGVEAPFVANAIDLLQLKIAYARMLKSILEHDARACGAVQ